MSGRGNHCESCPCGRELADECTCPRWRSNPLGSMRIVEPVGSRTTPSPAVLGLRKIEPEPKEQQ